MKMNKKCKLTLVIFCVIICIVGYIVNEQSRNKYATVTIYDEGKHDT